MQYKMLFAVLLTTLFSKGAAAAAWDPELDWHTVSTPHFNITFHNGELQLATELAETSEEIWSLLTEDMQTFPDRPTEIVLVDNTDIANGYAMTIPVNTIVIYVTAPTEGSSLGLYEDWLQAITTHEYAHILHLDTVEGIPKLLRRVLGRVIGPNLISPWWIVEGQATYQETRFTSGGRGRAPSAQMIIRMAILEDNFPSLGEMDGWGSDLPAGNTRYLFGQSFLQYIADNTTEDAWTRWNHTYGGWLPYALPAERVFGKSFDDFYVEWRAHLQEHFTGVQQQVESDGLSDFEIISDGESSCSAPTFSPDGESLVYSCYNMASGGNIFVANSDGSEPRVHLEGLTAKSFSWRPDSSGYVYGAPHSVGLYNSYYDVYSANIDGDRPRAMTSGSRMRDPELSPNGAELLMVNNEVQNNNLHRMRIDQTTTELTDFTDHTQFSTPRYSPNGEFIAVSTWHHGMRDIWIQTKDGEHWRKITNDTHLDTSPSFSPDGSLLYFSSERSGIPNIYAVDLQTEELWRVTNVVGGAFQPDISSDGQTLAFQSFSTNGHDIALMPIDRESWQLVGSLDVEQGGANGSLSLVADPNWRSGRSEAPPTTFSAEDEEPEETPSEINGYPVNPYNPMPTLVPPRYVMPSFYSTSFGLMGVLQTGGSDTLRQYGYSAYLTARTDNQDLGWGGAFLINKWRPSITFGAYSYTVPYGDIFVETPSEVGTNIPGLESSLTRYWDNRLRMYASVAYPLRRNLLAWVRWSGIQRSPLYDIPDNAYRPWLPTRGLLSSIGGGIRTSKASVYPYSISPEDARLASVTTKLTSSWLGSYILDNADEAQGFDQLQITGEIREYLKLPFSTNHVLALRVAGGASFGDRLKYGSFRLGGNYGESGYYALPDEYISLRGWQVASNSGDWYGLASAEYRFPIARIDSGYSTLPLFIKNLHGAIFVDAGTAFDDLEVTPTPLIGVGTELRLTGIVGWGLGLQARIGYAFALSNQDGAISPLSPESLYFRFGTSF
jgi:hypothetical protein